MFVFSLCSHVHTTVYIQFPCFWEKIVIRIIFMLYAMRLVLFILYMQCGIFTLKANEMVEILMADHNWQNEKCKNSEYKGMIVEEIVSSIETAQK